MSQGSPGGVFNRFPAWAIDRARFVAQRRAAGYTTVKVLAMLAELDARQRLNRPETKKGRGIGRK
ncbi:hypothetical protein [Nannocystis punicea]|uniref:Uncharacterized protein n=1 Tax=Nannocystis punicea TaxID=2995304 RepID=A0ABY7GY86_9BACT|nr:hypothetical protein [Nannocystis poenicansa]WAS91935.1 hypothetical protein O0S08_37610 [Nannocystis poenicansa]